MANAQPPKAPAPPPAPHGNVAVGGGHLVAPDQPAAKPFVDPDPAKTIADEQRERSAEIESMGVEPWKAANDDRNDDETAQPRQVTATVHIEGHKT